MKILYIAKHGQQNNDDEGSIYKSLTLLGHKVDRFQLNYFKTDKPILDNISKHYDFALFHKLPDADYVEYVCNKWKGICWYFDAVGKGFDSNDDYVNLVKDYFYIGLFTDGDFVNSQNKNNIKLLRQGLDLDDDNDVFVPNVAYRLGNEPIPFIFIGTIGHGGYLEREQYLEKLKNDFSGWRPHNKYDIFKEHLASVCRQTKIMLAMPPVTDHYWSNRVYLLGGRSAFVLHPYSSELEKQFGDSMAFYKDYEELKEKIDYFLQNNQERQSMSQKAHSIILNEHSYFHRCEELVETFDDYR
tara:strand:+ start:5443 stop:6342 length:900 start_codon:yes stop_codon:yes gene_type:complete